MLGARVGGARAWGGVIFVAVRDDQDANDGEGDGEALVEAEFVVEQHDGEDVGEKGGAVVDGGQVGGGGQVDGNIPRAAGHGEEGGDEGGGFDHVGPRGAGGGAGREVQVLRHDHLGGGFQDVLVSAPESFPGQFTFLNADDQELDGPQEDPGAVGQVHHAVSLVPFQLVLDVDGGLGLDDEGDEGEDEEEGCVDVLPAHEIWRLCICRRP